MLLHFFKDALASNFNILLYPLFFSGFRTKSEVALLSRSKPYGRRLVLSGSMFREKLILKKKGGVDLARFDLMLLGSMSFGAGGWQP